jgi:hypothetical protein
MYINTPTRVTTVIQTILNNQNTQENTAKKWKTKHIPHYLKITSNAITITPNRMQWGTCSVVD